MTEAFDKKNATIQDVARHANVSTATVSRTLTAPNTVSEPKRIAVLKAIQSTGYRVNRAARNLRTQRSNTVLALLPTLGNPFFSLVLQGIADALAPTGHTLVVADTDQIHAGGETLLNTFEDKRADGVIVLDGALPTQSIAALRNSPHHMRVVFACEWPETDGFSSVRSANEDGAQQAVRHLYDLGHRRITHVTGPKNNVLTQARCAGYAHACRDLTLEPSYIDGDFSLAAGAQAAEIILGQTNPPSAVFCASDEIAYGLIAGLTRAGLSVPDDVSVMGFDDIEYSAHFVPALTTIRQDRFALGQDAAHLLLAQTAQFKGTTETKIAKIPVTLVARSSTAPVNCPT